jgi:hypothetical protein
LEEHWLIIPLGVNVARSNWYVFRRAEPDVKLEIDVAGRSSSNRIRQSSGKVGVCIFAFTDRNPELRT